MKRIPVLCSCFLAVCTFFGPSASAQSAREFVIYNFCNSAGSSDCPGGGFSQAGLVQAADGNFYGTTSTLGGNNSGTLFRLSPTGSFSALYSFPGSPNSQTTYAGLVQGGDGEFYGTTDPTSNPQNATIFKITSAGDLTTLYTFSNTDYDYQLSALVEGTDGNFYGTTNEGGTYGFGAIFRVSPAGAFDILHNFGATGDGQHPFSGVIQASDGNFYGTTSSGGANNTGAIFRVTPAGGYTQIYSFPAPNNGEAPAPYAGLIEGSDGNLYGVTTDPVYPGNAYRITLDGQFEAVYNFQGGADGAQPNGNLLLGSDGNFYGVTQSGGANTGTLGGTVFELTPSGDHTVLYSFCSVTDCPDGAEPIGALIQASDGNFYGATLTGGPSGYGVVYELAPSAGLSPDVQLSLSNSDILLGSPVTLSWQVSNAFSATLQRCYAFVQDDAAGAGNWSGLQTGTLSGNLYLGSSALTPTARGTYTYALTCGGVESGFATLAVTVPPPLAITTASLPAATAGVQYSAVLEGSGGVTPYLWSVSSGSLPSGITLNGTTGVISGTPAQAGTGNFTVQLTDSASPAATAAANLSIAVSPPPPALTANPSTLSAQAPGDSVSTVLSVSNFAGSDLTFACSGLPFGATCSFSALSGTGMSGAATMKIETTAPKETTANHSHNRGAMLAILFPGLLTMTGIFGWRRKHVRGILCGSLLFVLCLLTNACGGSSAPQPGTPAGSSTVTITASDGSQMATDTVTLTVQ